jgi:hypothetical protein
VIPDQVWPYHVWPDHVWPDHVWPDHVWPDHVWPDHVWPDHVWPDHVWPYHVWNDGKATEMWVYRGRNVGWPPQVRAAYGQPRRFHPIFLKGNFFSP